ncbi:MAG: phosphonate ABC transporter ATP-binding protein [Nitrospinae bacterium]|nr:phosphonate ABC transporter ATP-binding protein [Nitrospinota bacterium]
MLRVEKLSKTYPDGTVAIKEVSFAVKPGEFVVVLGKSGSGKSTLFRCINRLVEPSGGQVYLDGREITGAGPADLRALRRRIGMIFQQYNLVRRMSVLTNVLTGRLGYLSPWMGVVGHFPGEAVVRAHEHLGRVDIGNKAGQRADALSGGQQQRVGIARALMQDPELILADEPVSSLDPASARGIMDLLKEINEKNGVTILCNLHLPALAREYGHRILALKAGEMVFDGAPGNLDEKTIEAFYGSA